MDITTKILKAAANERRVKILRYLDRCREKVVNEIAGYLKLSITATSKHLSKLESVGLVKKRQEGLWVYYSINEDKSKRYNRLFLDFLRSTR